MRIETRVSYEVSIITIARFERKLECDDKFNKSPEYQRHEILSVVLKLLCADGQTNTDMAQYSNFSKILRTSRFGVEFRILFAVYLKALSQ
jgi:hypothetical protein